MNLSTALPPRCPCGLGVRCRLRMRGCPSPSLDRFSAPTSQQLQAYQRLVLLILPLALCSQEYQREGEVCPSATSCSCQGCSQAVTIKSKGSQSSCSSSLTTAKLCACSDTPGQSSAQLSPSHSLAAPTPAFILLMQIYETLHICRELHYAGDVITAVPALHEE